MKASNSFCKAGDATACFAAWATVGARLTRAAASTILGKNPTGRLRPSTHQGLPIDPNPWCFLASRAFRLAGAAQVPTSYADQQHLSEHALACFAVPARNGSRQMFCPTCQPRTGCKNRVSAPGKTPCRSRSFLLCMGLFSTFWFGASLRGTRDRPINHYPTRCP